MASSSKFVLIKKDSCQNPVQYPEQLKQCAQLAAEIERRRAEKIGLFFVLSVFLLIQACLMVTEYSGSKQPPMFGDFEAQRHWMELTVNLPIEQWYTYDLQYWGLDYPPLTAYHSWVLGKISQRLNASWVQLNTSRGLEQTEHKLFMRLSVIGTMLALYAPALVALLFHGGKGQNSTEQNQSLLVLAQALLYPGLLFTDCAHFQYNHCSLGLFLWAVWAFESGRFGPGCAAFVLALNHKQMELYHALPIATFLLARSIRKCQSVWQTIWKSFLNLAFLASIVVGTFGLLWLPFLWPQPAMAAQVLRRLFPIDRGLFEDKVANFWCCASILVKFKQIYSAAVLVKISALLVLLACTPSLLCLLLRPNRANFRRSLVLCAFSFFLFSFQVHEKSILLVAIPALLLLEDAKLRRPTGLFLSLSNFSLFPLCLKDGVAEILPMFLFYHLFNQWIGQQHKEEGQNGSGNGKRGNKSEGRYKFELLPLLERLTLPVAMALCLLELLATPPARFPHLFPLLNALFSFLCFTTFWLWLYWQQLSGNWTAWRAECRTMERKKRK